MPLFAVRIFNLMKRTGLLLMLDNTEKVPKEHDSFRPIVRLGRESGQEEISGPVHGRYAISARVGLKII